jgi:cell division septum initiation protein DivIVA
MSPPTPRRIETANLPTALRGYDRRATDRLLEEVASYYEELWLERKELREHVAKLQSQLEERAEQERVLTQTLATAHRAADDLRADARRDAEMMLRDARAERERLEAAIVRMRELVERAQSDLGALLQDTSEALQPEPLQTELVQPFEEPPLLHDLTRRSSTQE